MESAERSQPPRGIPSSVHRVNTYSALDFEDRVRLLWIEFLEDQISDMFHDTFRYFFLADACHRGEDNERAAKVTSLGDVAKYLRLSSIRTPDYTSEHILDSSQRAVV